MTPPFERHSNPSLRHSSLNMQRTIHLPIYGPIEHGPDEDLFWNCFQTEPLARLRDISLSSTTSRFTPHGQAASRFQHSVGASFLARKITDWRSGLKPYRDVLTCAAICHDTGSPPFSHIAEPFFYDLTGRTHEQQTELLLAPGTELHELMTSYEVDASQVVDTINGRHPQIGPLMAGSIDIDNIDNSLHLLVSLGYHDYLPYHPLKLVQAFRFRNDTLTLDSDYLQEILGWAEARKTLYALLYAEPNLSTATMLYRAMEFAYHDGVLGEEFFALGESDALHHLRFHGGDETVHIINRLLRWKQYGLVHTKTSKEEDKRLLSLYDNWQLRKQVTDRIANELGLLPQELALYVGRERGEKTIKLPFVGEHANAASQIFTNRQGRQRLSVFASKRIRELHSHDENGRVPAVEQVVNEAIAELPEATGEHHVFF